MMHCTVGDVRDKVHRGELAAMRWGQQFRFFRDEVIAAMTRVGNDTPDLKVPVKTIYTWRHRDTGPRGFRVGKHLRFRWSDVEAWLADLTAEEG